MKRLLFIAFAYCCSVPLKAQNANFSSTAELARYLDGRYVQPAEKVEAAYKWVTLNIRYNTNKAFAMNHGPDARGVIDIAFMRRMGVCENFAAIFADLCQKFGLQAVVINGYTIQNNQTDRSGHAWSAVFVDGDWFLFDPTWDAGKTGDFKYFKKTGIEFLATHRPYDPMWQMMHYPARDDSRVASYFNYKDSIQAFLSADSLKQCESAIERVRNNQSKSNLSATHLAILKNNLEIKRQEEQMDWYDRAVSHMNEASARLNNFIDMRNDKFATVANTDDILLTLAGIDSLLDSASVFLDNVDASKAVLLYGTWPAREQLAKLKNSYAGQKMFLDAYLRGRKSTDTVVRDNER